LIVTPNGATKTPALGWGDASKDSLAPLSHLGFPPFLKLPNACARIAEFFDEFLPSVRLEEVALCTRFFDEHWRISGGTEVR
jgi:hypothetical protein